MIVRASTALRALFCTDYSHQHTTPEEVWHPVVVDVFGQPKRLSIAPKARDEYERAAECLKDLIPQWMGEALLEGETLVIPREEFQDLDEQVREHLEVLSS